MAGLTAIGVCSYNGIAFDGASEVQVATDFVKDEAGRTVTHHRYAITVRGIVAPGNGTADASLQGIRTALGEQGRPFIFINRGFGADLMVGPGQPLQDIECGPKPEVLMWNPIGSNLAAEIEWRVVVAVPVCDDTGSRRTGIMALNYGMTFNVDKHGDTTRTISGYIKVAVSRNGKNLTDHADKYFGTLTFSTIDGYERETDRSVSTDRSRVDFTITDRQIPTRNPYPMYVTDITGRHRARWSRGKSGMRLQNSISMQITPSSKVSPALAWTIFRDLVKQRTDIPKAAGLGVFIEEIEIEEDIYGRECSFAVSYRINTTLDNIVSMSGMWTPVSTNTWAQWRTSLENITGVRGTSGLKCDADVIVDLCGSEALPVEATQPDAINYAAASFPTFKNVTPPAAKSYSKFKNILVPKSMSPVVRQQILQPPLEASPGSPAYTDTSFVFPTTTGQADTLQEGGQPSYSVRMVGTAERIGYPIPRPALQAFGGATFKEIESRFAMHPAYNLLGVPVYIAAWDVLYAATKSPGTVIQLPNPVDGIASDGSAVAPIVV